MESVKINNENFFDPTPKLKSSPMPIKFISFNEDDCKCIYCEERYIKTPFCDYQKYCKKCLSNYLTKITDINIYIDAYYTTNLEYNKHGITTNKPQNIQILSFKQLPAIYRFKHEYSILCNEVIESENRCKLCKKSLYQGTDINIRNNFKLCSSCYLISSGYIQSTIIKKPIPIIHLPWWHNISSCNVCNTSLTFTSDCQKFCGKCLIFHTGCRYCLTTNIIFGLTTQSQCKKCKRVSSIIFDTTSKNTSDIDDFLLSLFPDIQIKNDDKYFLSSEINFIVRYMCVNYKNNTSSVKVMDQSDMLIKWIPYSQFTNVKEIAKGGFSIIYRATRAQPQQRSESVILKKLKNSLDISKYFLNELKSNQNCYEIKHHIIRIHGFTKDPKSGDYMLVIQYASGGDLHNWLQKKFAEITWNKDKLIILWQISEGLETIHKADYIHRDFHSGNILYDLFHNDSIPKQEKYKKRHQWLIGDLGSPFSKESDVYSMGMVMWELTTGCKPFADVEHNHNLIYKILDGVRPKITEDTPKCYADLMKSCWDPDPEKRPSAKIIRNTFGSWSFRNKNNEIFDNAELKRKKLLKSGKLGPEFAKKPHPKAIYTSRPLSSFISKCSTINSYISNDQEFDINIESFHSNSNYTSVPLNIPATLRKKKIEELSVENAVGRKRFMIDLCS
ncbi:kinase-like domain-containing protein [Rhizophagus clarus]|uniref:Kinase-like domain-containing protein n=1 Tax=Rhizophagus clarus TaxID=94130 RepID=A0A8H3L4I6_9GLOM|nr:kinase-like domain-containing protein [Rhizophagus clarus]